MPISRFLPTILWPFVAPGAPAPGLAQTRAETRRLVCETMDATEAHTRAPYAVRARGPRETERNEAYVICHERLLPEGARSPADAALLDHLYAQTEAIARLAIHPSLAGRQYWVEAHVPSPVVAGKVRFATQNALMAKGVAVSDRTPVLGPVDIESLSRLPPASAWPEACARYASVGALSEGDVLLATMVVDPRESTLHAGLCADGVWTWLR